MFALAATTPSAYWFLTRGTGAVTLVLLTVSVALGVLNVRRTQIGQLPRFVLDGVHRTAALLAVSFLLVHIATALLDGFAPITLLDVVIPFRAAYRQLWIGFGAVAFDLMIAVVVTSLVRRRLGYGAWRATHWLAYASWPVALLHGLGTGSDTKAHWMLLLSATCVAIMAGAALARIASGWPSRLEIRLPALGSVGLILLGLYVWLPSGPLAPGWARRAGTPASILAAAQVGSATAASPGASGASSTRAATTGQSQSAGTHAASPAGTPVSETSEHERSFSSPVNGTVHQSSLAGGQKLVAISLIAPGQRLDRLGIRIEGQALTGGGVSLRSSWVTLGPSADPGQYRGQVTGLQGSLVAARVSLPGYAAYTVRALLNLSPRTGTTSGTLIARAQEGQH
jgi:sulfoxide reductase heme-binding subunit YedZ